MSSRPSGALPTLADGDVYLYSHGNGAIFVGYADGRSMVVPLKEALSVVAGAHAAACRVVAGWDDTAIARAVLDRIEGLGIPVVEFRASEPPHSWGQGTNALIEAAALGMDHILDDLIARGADVDHRDDSGSTALHHAAASGRIHAVEALVAAGATLDIANDKGVTPHVMAMACREKATAQRLVTLGVDPSKGQDGAVRFSRTHYGIFYVWFVPPALVVTLVAFFWPISLIGWLGVAAWVAAESFIVPPLAFWAGGVPRRLDGATLTLRRVTGSTRAVDLTGVTFAGAGGSRSSTSHMAARWLLLAHPDGHPVSRRTLRRLLVPEEELDAMAASVDRVVVVAVDGVRRAEVILAVGNQLSGRGVALSRSLCQQLAQARSTSGRVS